jgi:hypothetical protein
MSDLPAILFLIDLSALLASQTREWQEFSRLGKCFVPQGVYQELKAMSSVAVEKDHELIAREFIRFLPESGWELSGAGAMHPALVPAPGQRESKRARLALAVAECAYGLARNSPSQLVVLISNDQALLQRLHAVQAPNLCGLPLAALLQWYRSSRRPPVVTHQMQAMKTPVTQSSSKSAPAMATVAIPVKPQSTPVRTGSRPPAATARGSRPLRPLISNHPSGLSQVMSAIWAVAAFTIAIGIVWYVAQPRSLNQFLRDLKLPTLPETSQVQSPLG